MAQESQAARALDDEGDRIVLAADAQLGAQVFALGEGQASAVQLDTSAKIAEFLGSVDNESRHVDASLRAILTALIEVPAQSVSALTSNFGVPRKKIGHRGARGWRAGRAVHRV